MIESNDEALREFLSDAVRDLGEAAALIRGVLGDATKYVEAGDIMTLAVALGGVEASLMGFVNEENDLISGEGER